MSLCNALPWRNALFMSVVSIVHLKDAVAAKMTLKLAFDKVGESDWMFSSSSKPLATSLARISSPLCVSTHVQEILSWPMSWA